MAHPEEEARFGFGKNGQSFLPIGNKACIAHAKESPLSFLEVTDLKGKTFIDIGKR